MSRSYYTLAVRNATGWWCPEFGDYDKQVVKDEIATYRDQGHKAKDLKIVTSGDKQADINVAIMRLNNPS